MANLATQISEGIKDAMRAKDTQRLAALRDIKTKMMLEATKEGGGEVDDAKAMAILSKLLKQRKETAELYRTQNREDLAIDEEAQAAVIEGFLPQPLTEEEIRAKREGNRLRNRGLIHGRHGQGHGDGEQSHGRSGRRKSHLNHCSRAAKCLTSKGRIVGFAIFGCY